MAYGGDEEGGREVAFRRVRRRTEGFTPSTDDEQRRKPPS